MENVRCPHPSCEEFSLVRFSLAENLIAIWGDCIGDPIVGLICSYKAMRKQALKICSDLGVKLEIGQGTLKEAISIAQEIIANKNAEAIISRGGTAAVLKKALSVPVVSADPTAFDILQTLYRAKRFSLEGPIGLMVYERLNFELPMFEEILGTKIRPIIFNENTNIQKALLEAYNEGVRVVAGGSLSRHMPRQLGMKGLLISSNLETIAHAIREAREIAHVKREEQKNAERVRAILNSIHDGVIAISEHGMISLCNPSAEKLLGITADRALGRDIQEVVPELDLACMLRENKSEFAVLKNIGNRQLVVNKVSVRVKGDVAGAVCTIQDVQQLQRIEQKIRREIHDKGLIAKFTFEDILGDSITLRRAVERAQRFAQTDASILIVGETGTGKELFAQSIHNYSNRREGPFVAINCAALPETLLESELFGYEEGTFTGAKKGGKKGLFQVAHKGTIFLDEIDRMPIHVQSRLLRVVQEKEVRPLGSSRIIPIDVRIIAATQEDLWTKVSKGLFLRDLYYRLNVLCLHIPPLREREGDVALLAEYFIQHFSSSYHKRVPPLTPSALHHLLQYSWPGNVRELQSFCERYCLLADEDPDVDHLVQEILSEFPSASGHVSQTPNQITIRVGTLAEMQNEILKKLSATVNNNSELARRLGICRTTLWKRLKQFKA